MITAPKIDDPRIRVNNIIVCDVSVDMIISSLFYFDLMLKTS
ncbi:MAG: hypothetical protein AAB405_02385 [Patescibacteria group bacterium]